MRVLIMGGSGLIGRALAHDLASAGNEVVILSRQPEKVSGFPRGVIVERWDGQTSAGWEALAEGADAIINLAGENIGSKRWTSERKRLILESRLNAGRAVVQAITETKRKPRVVIQASGIGYYGPRGDEEITEDAPSGHDYLAGVAVEWEASTSAVEAMGVRRVIIRTGVLLSPKGGAFGRMLLPFRLFVGGRLGSGRQWLPWIHVADEVGAIRFLLEKEAAKGPFNPAAPFPVTNADFSRLPGKRLGRPSFMPMPSFALQGLFGEMATVILDGQRAVPERLLKSGYAFRFANLESALDDIIRRPGLSV